MTQTSRLLAQIEGYCTRHGIAETTFGLRAANDGKLVARIRAGKTVTLRTVDRIVDFIESPVAPHGGSPAPLGSEPVPNDGAGASFDPSARPTGDGPAAEAPCSASPASAAPDLREVSA